MIEHLPLSIQKRYVFCCAPLDRKSPYMCTMFVKLAKECSKNSRVTVQWVQAEIGGQIFRPPASIMDLSHMEAVFDVLDIYLWLSQRFVDVFCDPEKVKEMQLELDKHIQEGVHRITKLFEESKDQASADIAGATTETPFANTIAAGKVTKSLMRQGILSNQMLQQLYNEWKEQEKKNGNKADNEND